MKAVTFSQYGSPEVLKLSEIEKPTHKDNEILVKMMATSVNTADVRLRKADPFLVRLVFGLFKPKIQVLGNIVSGIVEAVGKDVTNFQPGDEVFGLNDIKTMATYAEYLVTADTTPLSLKPKNMSFTEAAAVIFGGHTALYFFKKAGITKRQEVLIYGASGSVGTSAIQIAKYYGARVTAVCSTSNIELVKRLGADEVIDYTKQNLDGMDGQFDIVFETVNKSEVWKMAKLLKPNGALLLGSVIIVGAVQGYWACKKLNLRLIAGTASATSKDMEFIKELCENGNLKPVIDRAYTLDQMVEAHKYVDTGHKRGNVVVTID